MSFMEKPMPENTFELVVIGGGPGGYVAAIRAAQLGLKTAVVEREHLGGICLNWGCIPTKALLRSADVYRTMRHAAAYGLSAEGIGFDLAKVVARSRGVSAQLNSGVKGLLKKNKVAVFEGQGKLGGPGKVMVEGKSGTVVLSASRILLATGARARVLPGLEPDGKFIWTYRQALVPDTMPKRLLVIGSGAIGIEFASFFNALGSDVTVVEMMDRVLPVEDEDISALARKAFEKQGMTILTGARVNGLKKAEDTVTVQIETSAGVQEIEVERVISAVGIVPNSENLGLEGTKVRLERGHVVTNPWCETDEPGVYAIGDLTAPPWLAHKASHEGVLCVEKMAGLNHVHALEVQNIPGCTYCHPQVASVGLTEAKAKAVGYQVKVGRFPFIGNGKAIALGETEGMIKTVFDAKTGELLGAHMIGAEVTELIQGYTVAKTLETTEADIMNTVFPHPTLSEMMHESVLSAYGKAVHI